MTLDTRWKNPQGADPNQLYLWAQDLVKELRKGTYLDVALSGLNLTSADIAFAATQRVLGRNTAGAGAGEEVTLSQLLDWIGSPARGDLLVRGAASWSRLGIGANGRILTSDGTDPSWVAPATGGGITTIASGSLPAAATLSITSIPATYAYLVLHLAGLSSNTASRTPRVQVSTDNGSTYDGTASNYIGDSWDGTTFASTAQASLIEAASLANASFTGTYTVYLFGYQGGPRMHAQFLSIDDTLTTHRGRIFYIGSTNAINALQVNWSGTGNFDAGTYALYGVS